MSIMQIPLGNNKGFAIIDEEDYALVSQLRWHLHRGGDGKFYAYNNNRQRRIFMHHLILPRLDGMQVDHRNGNGLDNRRENLRIATISQNQHNKAKQRNNNSGYKGVHKAINYSKWQAHIRANGRHYYLGSFPTREEAARAYDAKARELHGEFARLNFPEDADPQPPPPPDDGAATAKGDHNVS